MQRRNFVFIYFHAMQPRREKNYIIGGAGIVGRGVDISKQVGMTGQPPGVFIGQDLVFPVQMGWHIPIGLHGVLVTVAVITVWDKKDEVFFKYILILFTTYTCIREATGPCGSGGGATGPCGGSIGPCGGSIGPCGGSIGPCGGSIGPCGGNIGPCGGSIGPCGGSIGPCGGSIGPCGGSIGPCGGSIGPCGGSIGPCGGSIGPCGGGTGANGPCGGWANGG